MQPRLVRHWVNGRFGMSRRTIHIWHDGEKYIVELEQGGSEGTRWRGLYPTERHALDEADRHMHHPQDEGLWRDVTALHRRRDPRDDLAPGPP